jgi:hypothetical protein
MDVLRDSRATGSEKADQPRKDKGFYFIVIPDAAERRSGIQKQALFMHLDSGFARFAVAPE